MQVGSYLHLTTCGYWVMPETVAVTTRFLFMKVGSGKKSCDLQKSLRLELSLEPGVPLRRRLCDAEAT